MSEPPLLSRPFDSEGEGKDPEARIRLLETALEVSRLVEPTEVGHALVSGGAALTGMEGGFLYYRTNESEGGEYNLLSTHLRRDDPRRKGLHPLRLPTILAEGGLHPDAPAVGPAPSPFDRVGFQEILSVPAGEEECRCYLLLGTGVELDEESAREKLECAEEFLAASLSALVNSIRWQRVRELVIKDDQTESYNRRYLDTFLVEEVERARRYGTDLSLIFMDLDDLKSVNSRYGHSAGSHALRQFSRRVLEAVRGSDKLFRYGGDEFCAVLPETDAGGAYELAERLRVRIAARPFEVQPGEEMVLTASFGVSSFPLHADSAAGLLASADHALTKVKLGGKNSIGIGTDHREAAGTG